MEDSHFIVRLSNARPELMTSELVSEHVHWLKKLDEEGMLIICGPCSDSTAIIILACKSLAEAQKIAASDPFASVGAYGCRDVVAFRPATQKNNFLLF